MEIRRIGIVFGLLGAYGLPTGVWAGDSEFHLDLTATPEYYPSSLSPAVNQSLYLFRAQVNWTEHLDDNVSLKFSPYFQSDPRNNSITERYIGDVPEAFVQVKQVALGPFSMDLQVGVNTFTWGVTDIYNPLDVVNPRRYEDPLNSEKLGAPSVDAHFEVAGGSVSLDGIYIPWQQKSILPGVNSRWLPRTPFQARTGLFGGETATVLPPSTLNYNYLDDQDLNNALFNNFGAKLEAHLPSLDLSLVFFDGEAPLPATDLALSGTLTEVYPDLMINSGSLIGITPGYYREAMAGASATYALGEFILRGEAAFTRVISQRIDLPVLSNEFVFEAEHDMDVGSGQLTVLLEGAYAYHSEPTDPSFVSLARMFDRSGILGFRYSPNSTLHFKAMGLWDTTYHGEMAHFDCSDSLTDAFKIGVSGDALIGQPSTPIGTYRQNDRVTASLSYSI